VAAAAAASTPSVRHAHIRLGCSAMKIYYMYRSRCVCSYRAIRPLGNSSVRFCRDLLVAGCLYFEIIIIWTATRSAVWPFGFIYTMPAVQKSAVAIMTARKTFGRYLLYYYSLVYILPIVTVCIPNDMYYVYNVRTYVCKQTSWANFTSPNIFFFPELPTVLFFFSAFLNSIWRARAADVLER